MKIYGNLSKLNGKTEVFILIGESGAGKSTLSEFLNMPDSLFVSSDLMIDIIVQRGLPVNHDTIHQIANEKYGEDPYWQIPYMLEVLNKTSLLLLDGPRRTDEVEKILELCPESVVVKMISELGERQKRLTNRDGADENAFKRIVKDEKSETGLVNHLLVMADVTVENHRSLRDLQDIAEEILTRLERR